MSAWDTTLVGESLGSERAYQIQAGLLDPTDVYDTLYSNTCGRTPFSYTARNGIVPVELWMDHREYILMLAPTGGGVNWLRTMTDDPFGSMPFLLRLRLFCPLGAPWQQVPGHR
jgi:hypothetical protein